ncbi:hypothetical protein QQ045_001297 [Rhodiola kirilowii]
MDQISKWVLIFSLTSFTIGSINCVEIDVKQALISFLTQLSSTSSGQLDPGFGWNVNSDPCTDGWRGVECNTRNITVRKLWLDNFNLSGHLDAGVLCDVSTVASSLKVLSLNFNTITGQMDPEIVKCKQLTRLHVDHNRMTGPLPATLAKLNNLKRLVVSNNAFSGHLPDLARISGLSTFLAQKNQFTGRIPNFDFSNFEVFNVSYNNLTGSIPKDNHFSKSSFVGNDKLCGEPLENKCLKPHVSTDQMLMYTGYALASLVILLLIAFKLSSRRTSKVANKAATPGKKAVGGDETSSSIELSSTDFKPSGVISKEALSVVKAEMSASSVSTWLVLLSSPVVNGLSFEDLLKAPAELLGRGRNGSVYKCIVGNGKALAVKRMKDWGISSEDFKRRMRRIDQVKHANVLPLVAFYSSKHEKLLVYDFQPNGSLASLIHGTQLGQRFDWGSRLEVAARMAEGLAWMHQELAEDAIPHGNLKSSNILFNKNMEPCISEYGLKLSENAQTLTSFVTKSPTRVQPEAPISLEMFQTDVYAFGLILLELLTGKLMQQNGLDLARWVHSVVREEWTVEVFDKALIAEGASEERMLNLLNVAIKCVNANHEARPSIGQVVASINCIKEDEERVP